MRTIKTKGTLFLLLAAMLLGVFGMSVPAAAAPEEEPPAAVSEEGLLPPTLGNDVRVDNELQQIYFVPQYFSAQALTSLLREARPDLTFAITSPALREEAFLFTGVTVSAVSGETGETADYTVFVRGDMDGTGMTAAAEARQALRFAVGLDPEAFPRFFRALDADGDGIVTAADARLLLRASVGLDSFGDPPAPAGDTLPGFTLSGDVAFYPQKTVPLKYDGLAEAINIAALTPKTEVGFRCARKTPAATRSVPLTEADRAVIEALFARLPEDATNLEKIYAAYKYIQSSFTYAYGYDLYCRIADKTPVDAVFNEHLAQCLQYNGAIAEVLAYMGYDVAIVEGMRGQGNYAADTVSSMWSHYWTELYLNGETYLIEVGQPKDRWNGAFMVRYADSDKRYLYYDAGSDVYRFLR